MNPPHMLVHVRAVLRLVLAVDASEVASLAMIAAKSWMSYYGRVLGRETVRNGRTGAMGKAGPAIAVGHGSTWKNCYKIRRIKQAIHVRAYSALINQRSDNNTHTWFRRTWSRPLTWKIYLSPLQENIRNLRDTKRKHKKQIYIRTRDTSSAYFQKWYHSSSRMIKIHSKIKEKENEICHITKWAITFLVLLFYDNPFKWSIWSI